MKIIHTDKAPAAVGPYVQGRETGGLFFFSGQIGLDPRTGLLPEGITAQTKQALNNVAALLEAAGLTRDDVIKTTVFITNMKEFGTVNELYAVFFADVLPARSCVEVGHLPKDALVEIECIAGSGK